MTVEELTTMIKSKLPGRAIDIVEALDLLLDTLNSTRLDIGAELVQSKDPAKMKSFVSDEAMNGRKVHYFSLSPQATMRKPIKIANAEFYIETNRSATRFVILLLACYSGIA